MPGALHGYMSEEARFESRGAARVENVAHRSKDGARAMRVAYETGAGTVARVSTPLLPPPARAGSYTNTGSPRLYPGMKVTVRAAAGSVAGEAAARLFVRFHEGTGGPTGVAYGNAVTLAKGRKADMTLAIPPLAGPVQDIGIEVSSDARAAGEVFVESVSFSGKPDVAFPPSLPADGKNVIGWITSADTVRSFERETIGAATHVTKNSGPGVLVAGTTDWTDYTLEANVAVHLADRAGLVVRYQGLEKYVAFVKTRDQLQIVLRHYGERILAAKPCRWAFDEPHTMRVDVKGRRIVAFADGEKVLEAADDSLGSGGAGFFVETGTLIVAGASVRPSRAGV